jgi:hypothetical protein
MFFYLFECAFFMLIFGLHIDALFQSNTLAYCHKIVSFSEKRIITLAQGSLQIALQKVVLQKKTYKFIIIFLRNLITISPSFAICE